MRSTSPRRSLRATVAALAVLLILLCALVPPVAEAAPTAPAAPRFVFHVDRTNLEHFQGGSGDLIAVCRDAYLPAGESLTLAGWLSTDNGVSGYRYLWVPAGGGVAVWQDVPAEQCTIGARGDLTAAQIPFPNGHATAGYSLTISPPEGISDGYYDVYLRAIDGAGVPCDFLSLLHLRYGRADADDGQTRTINFDRLAHEAEADAALLQNGAEIRPDGLYLPDAAAVRLGTFDLTGFETLLIEYCTLSGKPLPAADPPAILGLKSSDRHPFVSTGRAGYNLTDTIVYTLPSDAEGKLTADLATRTDDGEVWLTGALPEPIVITSISFVYNGNGSDYVAAKIHLSEALLPHFAGANAVRLAGVRDPLLGDILRIEVAEDTNDPYVHFYAEDVLAAADIRLSADHYRYMVILARSMPHNHGRHMALYLCAGTITGATGECTHSVLTENDGEWHYYLLDLTEVALWKGIIHGWRFDIINGDCRAGDAMDFASVQFFRTREAAEAAAARPIQEATPYRIGDAVVFPDLVEEQNGSGELEPSETYIVTESVTTAEPETEPETDVPAPESETVAESTPLSIETLPEPTVTSPVGEVETPPVVPDSSSASESEPLTETANTPGDGCRSHLPAATLLFMTLTAVALSMGYLRRGRTHT